MSIFMFSTMSASSFFWDIIIPVLGYMFILITLLEVAGAKIFLEISYVIINCFSLFIRKIQLRDAPILRIRQKDFWYIIAFIFIILRRTEGGSKVVPNPVRDRAGPLDAAKIYRTGGRPLLIQRIGRPHVRPLPHIPHPLGGKGYEGGGGLSYFHLSSYIV